MPTSRSQSRAPSCETFHTKDDQNHHLHPSVCQPHHASSPSLRLKMTSSSCFLTPTLRQFSPASFNCVFSSSFLPALSLFPDRMQRCRRSCTSWCRGCTKMSCAGGVPSTGCTRKWPPSRRRSSAARTPSISSSARTRRSRYRSSTRKSKCPQRHQTFMLLPLLGMPVDIVIHSYIQTGKQNPPREGSTRSSKQLENQFSSH